MKITSTFNENGKTLQEILEQFLMVKWKVKFHFPKPI